MDMLQDIQQLYQKYNLPKMIGFVPDRLEITVTRHGSNQFTLDYTERFTYLPDHALDTARENASQLIQQNRVPIEKIQPVERGVRIQITSDAQSMLYLILELLMQLECTEDVVKSQLNAIYHRYQLFTKLLDVFWRWNAEVKQTFAQHTTDLDAVLEEHPTFIDELMALLHKSMKSPTQPANVSPASTGCIP
jgi:hypothetical protein